MYKKVIHIFTIFNKGKQQVGIQLEGIEKYIYLSLSNIFQDTEVGITEVEILIDSELKPIFYLAGEKMFNEEICKEGHLVIKDFKFRLKDTKENLMKNNRSKCLPFMEILRAFHFERNSTVTVGFDVGEEKAIFVNSNRILGQTKLQLDEIKILQGSFISPTYFKEGENINFDQNRPPILCRKSGTVLKDLNLRFSHKVDEMKTNYEINNPPKPERRYYYSSNFYTNHHYDDYNNDNWLADAAGTDDIEVMNDVYWNMD